MKTSIITTLSLFMLLVSTGLFAQDSAIKEAEAAYTQENYPQAAALYEEIIKNNGESAEIYYNLGNAYYKSGKIASAILNYERALLIRPGDADIRFNLEMAKAQTTDRIEPLQEFFLTHWFRTVQNLVGVNTWATIGVVFFIVFIFGLFFFFFSKWRWIKKAGFYTALVCLVIIICANIFAYNQKKELQNRNGAIIFTPTVTIKSSPDTSGTDLFILHEGTKVFIKSQVNDWKEIELEDGNVGWINSKDIQLI